MCDSEHDYATQTVQDEYDMVFYFRLSRLRSASAAMKPKLVF